MRVSQPSLGVFRTLRELLRTARTHGDTVSATLPSARMPAQTDTCARLRGVAVTAVTWPLCGLMATAAQRTVTVTEATWLRAGAGAAPCSSTGAERGCGPAACQGGEPEEAGGGAGAGAAEEDRAGAAGRELCHLGPAACCTSSPSPVCLHPNAASPLLRPVAMTSSGSPLIGQRWRGSARPPWPAELDAAGARLRAHAV